MHNFDVVALREQLHAMPELGFQEVKTSNFVAEHLTELGYEIERGIGGTGVMAVVHGTEPGEVVLLRADMDALPFKNEDGSIERIHACGHDGHTAMLLAAAKELKGKVRRGTLKFLFQPAEEVLTGATSVIADGVIDDVDVAFGLHIRPTQDCPTGSMCAAVNHTSSAFIKIDLKGRATHASRPHLGVNCAEAAAMVTLAIAAIKIDPRLAWSAKVTGIHCGGAASNIIPDSAQIIVDARAQTNAAMDELVAKLRAAVAGAAAAFGAEATVNFGGPVIPAAEYDEDLTEEVRESIRRLIGEDKLAPDCGGGGEDFHFFKKHKPSIRAAYFGVGVGATPGLHARDMHFDPEYLRNGLKVLVDLALKHVG
ncbi:MAG: amidohydrolase [Duodenibacillus sp.]|nr:amidohydrolase [Duodenibacillus sp.]